eukprot:6192110-Pleurochrysis_carterae.AAC.3
MKLLLPLRLLSRFSRLLSCSHSATDDGRNPQINRRVYGRHPPLLQPIGPDQVGWLLAWVLRQGDSSPSTLRTDGALIERHAVQSRSCFELQRKEQNARVFGAYACGGARASRASSSVGGADSHETMCCARAWSLWIASSMKERYTSSVVSVQPFCCTCERRKRERDVWTNSSMEAHSRISLLLGRPPRSCGREVNSKDMPLVLRQIGQVAFGARAHVIWQLELERNRERLDHGHHGAERTLH